MGILEKMKSFLKKKPTQAELERMDKKKVELDRGRMESIRARLEAAAAFPRGRYFSPEDEAEIRELFRSAADCAKNAPVVGFDTTGIDTKISGIVTILERAVKEGGSVDTIKRCFQGIAYGIINAHGPISENAIEADVVRKRDSMTDRYLRIAQASFEIDQKQKDVDRKQDEKRQRKLEQEAVETDLQAAIDEHPSVYYEIKDMTPTERSTVTGDALTMAGLMDRAVKLDKAIRHLDLLIGQRQQDIYTLESMNNTLSVQLQRWENEVDSQTIADVERLSKEFEFDLLKQKQMIKDIDNTMDRFDIALNDLLGGKDAKIEIIQTMEDYNQMKQDQLEKQANDAAGRQRYEAEQEALRQEAEQQANEQMSVNTQKQNAGVYYN